MNLPFTPAPLKTCVPELERASNLKFNQDFTVGYGPERINPGNKQRRLTAIPKVTTGSTPEAADFVGALYRRIITAGTHKASSLKVAGCWARPVQDLGH